MIHFVHISLIWIDLTVSECRNKQKEPVSVMPLLSESILSQLNMNIVLKTILKFK